MDSWERFDETSLPDKEAFYSNLNMEGSADIDYSRANKVIKIFKMNNLGDYHDLYVNSDTVLLADVFGNFRNMFIKVYELDPAHFFICTRISIASLFKENRSRVRTDNSS